MYLQINRSVVYLVVAGATFLGASSAQAIPPLQLYLEGATYDTETETWVLVPSSSSGGEPFRLWTLGNIVGPGGHGPIADVRLSVAYAAVDVAPTITLTPSQIGGLDVGTFKGWSDHTVPAVIPSWTEDFPQPVIDGSSPTLGDGSDLPSHGIFGPGTHWQEFSLGNFGGTIDDPMTDDPVGDIIGEFPFNPQQTWGGQINAYDVSVLNGSGLTLHFDLYDTIWSDTHAKFAPFSHDAEIVPLPGAALLAMTGLGLAGIIRRRLP